MNLFVLVSIVVLLLCLTPSQVSFATARELADYVEKCILAVPPPKNANCDSKPDPKELGMYNKLFSKAPDPLDSFIYHELVYHHPEIFQIKREELVKELWSKNPDIPVLHVLEGVAFLQTNEKSKIVRISSQAKARAQARSRSIKAQTQTQTQTTTSTPYSVLPANLVTFCWGWCMDLT